MHLLEAAKKYLSAGLCPIPIWPDRRKNPRLSNTLQYTETLPTIYDWQRWAHNWPNANIGLITGYWQYVALDFDSVEDYDAWDGPKGQTWTVATGRGYHVWFWAEANPGKSRMFVCEGREVLLRAKGGYCISPPSTHWTGVKYRTVHNVEPMRVDNIYDFLDGWTEKQTARPKHVPGASRPKQQGMALEDLVPIPDGSRPNSRGAYQVYCPFHSDSKPSAWLNPKQGRFGCNACWPGLWWDVVNVYAKLNSIDNGEAWKVVRGET